MPTTIITRAEWKAHHPTEVFEPLKTPVKIVLLLDIGCSNSMSAQQILEWLPQLQQVNMNLDNSWDINYNWLVDRFGNIYEGRGWKTSVEKIRPKYKKFNGLSIDIGFIGNFKDKPPPRSMERTATRLLELGMKQNFIVQNRELEIYNSWYSLKVGD